MDNPCLYSHLLVSFRRLAFVGVFCVNRQIDLYLDKQACIHGYSYIYCFSWDIYCSLFPDIISRILL